MKMTKRATMLTLPAVMVLGVAANVFVNERNNGGSNAFYPVSDETSTEPATPMFSPISGRVTLVASQASGGIHFVIEDENANPAVIISDFNTMFLNEVPVAGSTITAYYLTDGASPMIWPPQYNARLIANNNENITNLHIDRFFINSSFGGALVSYDGGLLLNFNENTQILLQDEQNFREIIGNRSLINEMDGRLLVVIYGPTTRSIPAQTIPGENGQNVRIFVLFEAAIYPQDLPIFPSINKTAGFNLA